MAVSLLYNPYPIRMFEADGDFASGALAYFYLARTTTPLVVYTDNPLSIPHTWPVVADAYGLFAPIYIAKGTEYKVRIEDAAHNILYAADGIANPEETESSGLVITPDMLVQTGYFSWQPTAGTRLGWVRANGLTISSAAGSGSERRNNDCQALFSFFWDGFSDLYCPVVGGRGSSAAADWSANKEIATLDMRGQSARGTDDMGNTAANVIQKVTTITTTSGSATATVGNISGLCAGMYIIASNITPGTYITSLAQSAAISLSAIAPTTASAVSARFSIFRDAYLAGSSGGATTHIITESEMPYHNHEGSSESVAGTNTQANMLLDGGNAYTGGANRPVFAASGSRWSIGFIAPKGGGISMNLHSPTRLGAWFVKI
jgi:hypothetical protein